jgi:hypothetical protein
MLRTIRRQDLAADGRACCPSRPRAKRARLSERAIGGGWEMFGLATSASTGVSQGSTVLGGSEPAAPGDGRTPSRRVQRKQAGLADRLDSQGSREQSAVRRRGSGAETGWRSSRTAAAVMRRR